MHVDRSAESPLIHTLNRIRIIYPSRSQDLFFFFFCKFHPISSVERQKERLYLCSSYYRSSVNDGCVQLSGRNRPVCSGALQGADPGAVSSWGSWCLTGSPQFTLAANAQQEVFRHWLSSSGTDLPAWSLSLKQCHPATICMYIFRVCVSLLIIIVGDISVTASSVFIQVYSSCCCCYSGDGVFRRSSSAVWLSCAPRSSSCLTPVWDIHCVALHFLHASWSCYAKFLS